jgi:predicted MPP superfamily phosphohydrolase
VGGKLIPAETVEQVRIFRAEGRTLAEISGLTGLRYQQVENLVIRKGFPLPKQTASHNSAPPSTFALDVPVRPFSIAIPKPPTPKEGKVFKAVVYGDTHVPFHDPAAIRVVQAIAKDVKPDVLLHVGDLVDCWQISRFDKDPTRSDSLQDNIDESRQHLAEMALVAPKARRVLLEGNHESRLTRTVWGLPGAARELPKLRLFQKSMTWPTLLELDAIGWEWVPEREQSRTSILPKLITKHGTVVRKWSAATAKGEWEKYGASGLSGHTHRLGHFLHRDHNGTASWIETGCTCLLDPPYGTDFDWAQGCIVLTWNKDRRLMQTELISMRNGAALWRDQEIAA